MNDFFGEALDYHRSRLNAERTAFCETWLRKRDDALGRMVVVLVVLFHGGSLLLDPIIADQERTVEVLRYAHLVTLAIVLGWYRILRPLGMTLRVVTLPLQVASIAGYLYLTREYIVDVQIGINLPLLRMWTTCMIIAVFQIMMTPTVVWVPAMSALLMISASLWAWWPSEFTMKILPISCWAFVAAMIFQWAQMIKTINEALREFDAREKVAKAVRARLERELELAREIQDSLSPPDTLKRDNVIAYCFQKKHSQVGGDWAAMRLGDHGEFYAVVADAAGKGVQAALVIHAVQSLWAETLGRLDFEPLAWIERVNHALCQLGEKQPHMVTLGIIRIHNGKCVYWSAGHLPLFVVLRRPAGEDQVRVILGRGTPLGLKEDIHIEPAETDLTGNAHISLLLGSDGVFDKGTLYRSKDIIAIRDGLRQKGNAVLEDCLADDDKTLIWIDKPAA